MTRVNISFKTDNPDSDTLDKIRALILAETGQNPEVTTSELIDFQVNIDTAKVASDVNEVLSGVNIESLKNQRNNKRNNAEALSGIL